ncbi:MAG: FAD-dependent oxidoreductase [Paracoccaceae bacterium]
MTRARPLAGWGRHPVRDCTLAAPETEAEAAALVAAGPVIARGNGRAYGDSALGVPATLSTRRMNRMRAFDPATGVLESEAGVLLADIIDTFLPRGWFPAVTPGTKFVTLGGMIAADVHGKNHHRDGAMGETVLWLDLLCPDGRVVRCGPGQERALFEWTVGGMGLTGVILRAAIRLRPVETGWIRQVTRPARDLSRAIELFEENAGATYSVAWIDCLATGAAQGRSIVMLGEHARRDQLPDDRVARPFRTRARRRLSVPFDLPGWLLNRYSARAFNAAYWNAGLRGAGVRLVDWDSYFYPLDSILGWNRVYGRRGFAQFQCVLPLDAAETGLQRLLNEIARAGQGAFLGVLKRMGAEARRFSFPMPGYTLALDFPSTPGLPGLLARMDDIVQEHGGRFYLAKDSHLTAETLRRTDPRSAAFARMRSETGAAGRFVSAQSERLSL